MRYILVPLLIVLSTVLTQAQTGPACNEKAIRDAVQSQAFEYADDTYFSSGAFDKPLIGKAAYEEASKAVRSERANEQRVQHPQRVVVSSSGDLAV